MITATWCQRNSSMPRPNASTSPPPTISMVLVRRKPSSKKSSVFILVQRNARWKLRWKPGSRRGERTRTSSLVRRTVAIRNRPVLMPKETGKVLTKKERETIGFKSFFTFYSKLRYNCNQIEERLQKLIENTVCNTTNEGVPLGLRLHRHVAAGSNQEDLDQGNNDYWAKVFFTIAPYDKVKNKCLIIL